MFKQTFFTPAPSVSPNMEPLNPDDLKNARSEAEFWGIKMAAIAKSSEQIAAAAADSDVWSRIRVTTDEWMRFSYLLIETNKRKRNMQFNLEHYSKKCTESKETYHTQRSEILTAQKKRKNVDRVHNNTTSQKKQKVEGLNARIERATENLNFYRTMEANSSGCTTQELAVEKLIQERDNIEKEIETVREQHTAAVAALSTSLQHAEKPVQAMIAAMEMDEKCLKMAEEALKFVENAETICKKSLGSTRTMFVYLIGKLKGLDVQVNDFGDVCPFMLLTSFNELDDSLEQHLVGWTLAFQLGDMLQARQRELVGERISLLSRAPIKFEAGKPYQCYYVEAIGTLKFRELV